MWAARGTPGADRAAARRWRTASSRLAGSPPRERPRPGCRLPRLVECMSTPRLPASPPALPHSSMRPWGTRQWVRPPTLLHFPYSADSPSQKSLATPKSGQRCSPRPSRHAHPPRPLCSPPSPAGGTPSRHPKPVVKTRPTFPRCSGTSGALPPPRRRPPSPPAARAQRHCHRGHGTAPCPLPCGRAPPTRPRRPTRPHWRAPRAPPPQRRQLRAEPSGVAVGPAAPPAAAATLAAATAGGRPLRDRPPHREPPRRGRPCPGTLSNHHWGASRRTARGRRRRPCRYGRPPMAWSPSAGCSQMASRAALRHVPYRHVPLPPPAFPPRQSERRDRRRTTKAGNDKKRGGRAPPAHSRQPAYSRQTAHCQGDRHTQPTTASSPPTSTSNPRPPPRPLPPPPTRSAVTGTARASPPRTGRRRAPPRSSPKSS